MPAQDLIGLVEELGGPYGLEKSAKMVPGALWDDRCLISLHRNRLGPAPLATLTRMAEALGAPAVLVAGFAEALDGADVVHFGHEAGGGSVTRKLYFEYAGRARRAIAAGQPVLVHLAFKWAPGRPEGAAVTHYGWAPCRNRAEATARIEALVPAQAAPRALRVALRLLAAVSALAEAGHLPIMTVEEPGNPRRSCDLNVYDAALRLGDVDALLTDGARAFGIGEDRLRAVFGGAGASLLGHLSAGLDRTGREFVTVYHGIEARGEHRA